MLLRSRLRKSCTPLVRAGRSVSRRNPQQSVFHRPYRRRSFRRDFGNFAFHGNNRRMARGRYLSRRIFAFSRRGALADHSNVPRDLNLRVSDVFR